MASQAVNKIRITPIIDENVRMGMYNVFLNDIDISSCVRGVTFDHEVGMAPMITLKLIPAFFEISENMGMHVRGHIDGSDFISSAIEEIKEAVK